MFDLKAESTIVTKRSVSYALPGELEGTFTPKEADELRVHFGVFDGNGDGSIEAEELRQVLARLGHEATPQQVQEIVETVDQDKSGVIEFAEFAVMMGKIKTGELDVGASALAQAIVDTKGAMRLQAEVDALQASVSADSSAKQTTNGLWAELVPAYPPTCQVTLHGPPGTPYAGGVFRMMVQVSDDYPYSPPNAWFTCRVFHLNFALALDGTTRLAPLTAYWDASWDLNHLVQQVLTLLDAPDRSLVPMDVLDGTRHDSLHAQSDVSNPRGYDLREKSGGNKFAAEACVGERGAVLLLLRAPVLLGPRRGRSCSCCC